MTSSLYIKVHQYYVKRKKKEWSHQLPHVRLSRLRNPGNFSLWNPPSRALDFGIWLKEFGILTKNGNPESMSH